MQTTESRLDALEQRNARVEADKAWETSSIRRLLIITLTYIVVGIFLTTIQKPQPWVNAIVPSLGFLLSTLTLQGVKRLWLRRRE